MLFVRALGMKETHIFPQLHFFLIIVYLVIFFPFLSPSYSKKAYGLFAVHFSILSGCEGRRVEVGIIP
jgi:hypothetical protein